MATTVSFNTCKSSVISILQASATPYATTVDGSNQQYNSDTEIANAILNIDGEVCTAICMTLGHPYAPQFSTETAALASGANITKNVGIVQKVTVLNGIADETFTSANVDTTADTITISGTKLVTGTKVRFTTGGSLPTGISLATDYWIIRVNSTTIQVASSIYNAKYGTAIDLTGAGSGSSTIVIQYVDGEQAQSKDEILEVNTNPQTFGSLPGYVTGFWFVEGDVIYCTSPLCKVTYTDYTLTSSPQAPESYINAVIAGAVSRLAKDGFDSELTAYYGAIYSGMLEQIRSGAKALPEISAYKGVGI